MIGKISGFLLVALFLSTSLAAEDQGTTGDVVESIPTCELDFQEIAQEKAEGDYVYFKADYGTMTIRIRYQEGADRVGYDLINNVPIDDKTTHVSMITGFSSFDEKSGVTDMVAIKPGPDVSTALFSCRR